MNKQQSIWTAWLALTLGVGVVPLAHATATWQFTGPTATLGAARTSESGQAEAVYGVGITGMQGVYAANGGPTPSTVKPADNSNPFGSIHENGDTKTYYSINGMQSGAKWQDSGMTFENKKGLGMSSDGSKDPNDKFDNGPQTTDSSNKPIGLGNTEALVLSFSSSVVLTAISIMDKSGDADISLLRWVGSTAPSIVGSLAAGPTSFIAAGAPIPGTAGTSTSGWQLVGNYANLENDDSYPYKNYINGASDADVAGTTLSLGSSWWMISAYNTNYGTGTGLNQGDDYFKIYAVAARLCDASSNGTLSVSGAAGSTCGVDASGARKPVSEPASLALVSLGLIGVAAVKRRRRKAQEAMGGA